MHTTKWGNNFKWVLHVQADKIGSSAEMALLLIALSLGCDVTISGTSISEYVRLREVHIKMCLILTSLINKMYFLC